LSVCSNNVWRLFGKLNRNDCILTHLVRDSSAVWRHLWICCSRGTSESYAYGKQRICFSNSGSAHFHVSWLSDFIFYQKPLYKFASPIIFLFIHNHLTPRKWCYTPLQHDSALDPIIRHLSLPLYHPECSKDCPHQDEWLEFKSSTNVTSSVLNSLAGILFPRYVSNELTDYVNIPFKEKCELFCKKHSIYKLISDYAVNCKNSNTEPKLRPDTKLIEQIRKSGTHNYLGCKIPVQSGINVQFSR
jgi:hypothetical protein